MRPGIRYFFLGLFLLSIGSQLQAQNPNVNFEQSLPGTYTAAGSVSGWTLSSQTSTACTTSTVWTPGSPEFSLLSTPVMSVPLIGNLPHSPLGGTVIAQLNNFTANSSVTRLSKTFFPSSTDYMLDIAYATVVQTSSIHLCCEQPAFKFLVRDANGLNSCFSRTLSTQDCSSFPVFHSGNGINSGWKITTIALNAFINTSVTVEIVAQDCTCGQHNGTLFLDARLNDPLSGNGISIFNTHPSGILTEYCIGSPVARLTAPDGYYNLQWYGAGTGAIAAPQGTQQVLVIQSPVPGAVYTLTAWSPGGCQYLMTGTIYFTTLQANALSNSPSCMGGSSGAATVHASGSASSYSYAWKNQLGNIVGSNSVATGLPPGNYSVTVSSSIGCGTVQATVSVGTRTNNTLSYTQPYCNNTAFLIPPPGTGHQWYHNNQPIAAAAGGTLSAYTVQSASNGAVYALTYSTTQGCNDSIVYTLMHTLPGTVTVSYNKLICLNGNNGLAVISLTPAAGTTAGQNSFIVTNSNTNTPVYNSSVTLSAANSFSATNLSAMGHYTVNVFDGACAYNTSFSVSAHFWDYSLSVTSATVCSGNYLAVSVQHTGTPAPGTFSYAWSPLTSLVGGSGQVVIFAPALSAGSTVSTIYSVAVTPSVSGCVITKTLQLSSANLLTPTIAPVPDICRSANPVTLSAMPPGGNFISTNPSFMNMAGMLTPSAVSAGTYTFMYSTSFGTCNASANGSVTVKDINLSVTGNTAICAGQSATLTAGGATSYTWSTMQNQPVIIVSPVLSSSYQLAGFDQATGCSQSKTADVKVYPLPLVSVAGPNQVCVGTALTLTASGAGTYLWNGTAGSDTFSDSPQTSQVYTVTGQTAPLNCTTTQTLSVTVHSLPLIYFSGDTILCAGDAGILTAHGAGTYTWQTGQSSASFNLQLSTGATFTVQGTDLNGCTNSASVNITVNTCTGLNGRKEPDQLAIAPNPFQQEIQISGVNYPSELSIYNLQGVKLSQQPLNAKTCIIPAGQLIPGMYILQISEVNGQGSRQFRVIKH